MHCGSDRAGLLTLTAAPEPAPLRCGAPEGGLNEQGKLAIAK